MNYSEWQLKVRELTDKEQAERRENWQQARPPLRASVTDQAIRELYSKLDSLEKALEKAGRAKA